jgi:hypothetical protein
LEKSTLLGNEAFGEDERDDEREREGDDVCDSCEEKEGVFAEYDVKVIMGAGTRGIGSDVVGDDIIEPTVADVEM